MTTTRRLNGWRRVLCAAGVATTMGMLGAAVAAASEITDPPRWTSANDFSPARHWNVKAANIVPHGTHPLFFPLVPGHKHVLEQPDHRDGHYRRETKVLEATEAFDIPDIGAFRTAIVQDEEMVDGIVSQRTLTWMAIDRTTNSVLTFGEEVWEIDDTGKRAFANSWRAGEPAGDGLAEPGLLMPGTPTLGARFVFYGNDNTAYGGSEITEVGITVAVPAGRFSNCLRVRDQGLRVLTDITDQTWCLGVGLVLDSSGGKLVASAALPKDNPASDVSSVGQPRDNAAHPRPTPKFSPDQAAGIALQLVTGKVTDVKIERKRGKSVFTVEIMTADGGEKDVFVDIQTGEIVGTE